MTFLSNYPILRDDRPRRFDLADIKARHDYLVEAVNTEALFSFMSGLVVRRSTWLSVPPALPFMGSCWGHVARLLTLAQHRLCVHYVGEVWLDKRGDNDSFMDRGVVNRFRIAVDGFSGIVAHFYGAESFEAVQVKRFLRNELTLPSFMAARELVAINPQRESKEDLDRMVEFLYGDEPGLASFLTRNGYRYCPLWAYRFARDIYRAFRPWFAEPYPLRIS
jgi:abequosyltransferase